MAPTVRQLIESRLITAEVLSEVLDLDRRHSNEAIIQSLLDLGLITSYQLGQLIKGRKNFRLGRFLIKDWIGTSGNNVVFEGVNDTHGESQYAVIHGAKNATKTSSRSFCNSVLADLHAGYWDASIEAQISSTPPYFIVGFGEPTVSLEELAHNERLTLRHALRIGISLTEIICESERIGVVHGDINPRIIRCSKSSDSVRVLPLASNDWSMGSPMLSDFLPPERYDGELTASLAGDIYCLGCVVYFCVTGKVPFFFKEARNRRAAHRNEFPYHPRLLDQNIGEGLVSILAAMMDKRPENRPAAIEVSDVISEEYSRICRL